MVKGSSLVLERPRTATDWGPQAAITNHSQCDIVAFLKLKTALGLIAGALGKLIMPGDDLSGIIVTILLGYRRRLRWEFTCTSVVATIGAIIFWLSTAR